MTSSQANRFNGSVYGKWFPDGCWNSNESECVGCDAIINQRAVQHDGYCSDPGEDEGEWEHNIAATFKLSQKRYDEMRTGGHFDSKGVINPDYLKQFNRDDIGCDIGSGYCGYTSQLVFVSAKIKSCDVCQEYVKSTHCERCHYNPLHEHRYCDKCQRCITGLHAHCTFCDVVLLAEVQHRWCDKCRKCVSDPKHKHCSRGAGSPTVNYPNEMCPTDCIRTYKHMHCGICDWVNDPGPFVYHRHCRNGDTCSRTDQHFHESWRSRKN